MTTADFFLPPTLVAAALEELTRECHTQIDRLARQPKQGDPTVKDETKFWLAQYRAFTKASYYWARGVRPAVSDAGAWLIPSASQPGAVVHEVSRHGGVWVCGPTCEAGKRGIFHWHSALLNAIERAFELADLHDDGPEYDEGVEIDEEPYLPPTTDEVNALRARIAAESARQMNELFAA